jgi:hypothetical protein
MRYERGMDIKLGRKLRLNLRFYSQWENPFSKKLNWLDFDLVHLGFEHDRVAGQFEVYLGLLGLNLTLTFWRLKTTVKPTGSISTLNSYSYGIEPVLSDTYTRTVKLPGNE